ncbi:MAG TPA: two-component regulator propeller domain-containing protein, partial [Chitinophagaceae bacterium]|nr:two-component regulator propeller domain-containing protein [Chitinophagaceae bacterium]
MYWSKLHLILFISVLYRLLLVSPSHAQKVFFNKVPPPEGQKFIRVTGMVQDQQGYIWFTTKKGLFRYDGYHMKQFKHHPDDANSLAMDDLETLCIDSSGLIWIATNGAGLDRFDPATGRFTHFKHDAKNAGSLSWDSVQTLLVSSDGTLWVGTLKGLDRYEPKTGKFFHYRHQPNDPTTLSYHFVWSLYEDRQGTIWVGTGCVYDAEREKEGGGLNRLNRKTGTFTRYLHDPNDDQTLANNKVHALFEDSRGNFWVGTSGDGLHIMDRKSGRFQRYPHDPEQPEKLSRPRYLGKENYDYISFITEDAAGAIWIGTPNHGIVYYNPKTGKAKHYLNQKDTAGAYSDFTSWCAYNSRDGMLWIGTEVGNLYRIDPSFENYLTLHPEPGTVYGMTRYMDGRWVASWNPMLLDSKGRFWMCTMQGLRCYNTNTNINKVYNYNPANKSSLSNDMALAVIEDRKGEIWISTASGLNKFIKEDSFQRYYIHPQGPNDIYKNVFGPVITDQRGMIWAYCLADHDVHRIHPKTGRFETYLKSRWIQSIYEDASGTVWAGGDDGLFRYDRRSNAFLPYNDSTTHTAFKNIRYIIEDDHKNLWLKTENKMLHLNPQRKVERIYKVPSRNLRFLDFDMVWKADSNKLFFGGNYGYYIFREDSAKKPPPQIVITFSSLSDSLPQGISSQLSYSTAEIKKLHLKHTQNSFALEFAGIDFTSPEDNRHFFMLQNYDADWKQAGPELKAIYYNVPPGDYTFRVKAATSSGIWAEKSIRITIAPPWWNTWWFRILAATVLIAALYGLIRWRLKRKFRIELQESEKKREMAMLQQKATELEMQALRAQMSPHFIFNSLNSINHFIVLNDKDQASAYLIKF